MEVNLPQNIPLALRFPHPLFWNKGSQVHIICVLNEKQKLGCIGWEDWFIGQLIDQAWNRNVLLKQLSADVKLS
jgi:hypothetical protein